jgi:hypothetical protein
LTSECPHDRYQNPIVNLLAKNALLSRFVSKDFFTSKPDGQSDLSWEANMVRIVGACEETSTSGETVNAFGPALPHPNKHPLIMDAKLTALFQRAEAAVSRLKLA